MVVKFGNSIDLDGFQLRDFVVHNAAVAPSSTQGGAMYWDTADNNLKVFDSADSSWRKMVQGTSFSLNNAIALWDGTTGKRLANSGITITNSPLTNSATSIPVSSVIKSYVDTAMSGVTFTLNAINGLTKVGDNIYLDLNTLTNQNTALPADKFVFRKDSTGVHYTLSLADLTTLIVSGIGSGGDGFKTWVLNADSGFTWGTNNLIGATNDTLRVVAGAGIQIATDSANKAIRINSTTLAHNHSWQDITSGTQPAPVAHGLVSALHTVSGLTTGHFLKALSPVTYGFAAHGLTYTDVGAIGSAGTSVDREILTWNLTGGNQVRINTGAVITSLGHLTVAGDVIAFASGSPNPSFWDSMPKASETTMGGFKFYSTQFEWTGVGNDQLKIKDSILVPASHTHAWTDITSVPASLTSIIGLTYSSTAFVKMTAAGTFTLDTTTYYAASNPSGYTSNTGTVTSVAALTLGTTGTDLSSSVATGTTTPVITLNVPTASATNRGALSAADWSTFNGKQAALNGTGFVKATGTTISYDNTTYQSTAEKGVANGYASLNSSGQVPSTQLPSYVDDVLEYANLAAFPVTGEAGKIYVTADTNKTYRWSGSAYVEISASPGSTDAVTEGTTNLYFTNARARAAVSFTAGSGAYNSTTGVFTIPTNTNQLTNGAGFITSNQSITLSGDVSGSGTTAITTTLATITQSTGSSFVKITLDTKGRVTGNTTVAASDLNSTFGSQTANTFYAAPNGTVGNPTFRAIVAADIPTLNQNTTGSAGSVANSFVLRADSGTTEGTDIYTFNGSAGKNINIIAGTNISITKAAGSWTIASTGTGLNGTGYVKMSGTTVSYIASIPNTDLANSSITVQGASVSLGGSVNVINGTGFIKASGTTISYDNSTYALSSHTHTNMVDYTGTPLVNQVAYFLDSNTIQGNANFTFNGTLVYLGTGQLSSGVVNGATAIGFKLSTPSYTTVGAKLLSILNNTTEKMSLDKDGTLQATGDIIAYASGTPPTFDIDSFKTWTVQADSGYTWGSSNVVAAGMDTIDFVAGAGITITSDPTLKAIRIAVSTGGGMVYPGAGIPVSTGSAWGTSITDNSTNWNTAYSQRIATFTTTGNSGAATFSSNTLNIPTYTLAGLGGQASHANLTSLSGLSYTSPAFVKMTGANTFTLDTTTYLSAEADTLATVTGRGATTSTASSFTGGATIRGLIVDNATATHDRILVIAAAVGAARFDGTITNADLTAARTYTLPDVSGTIVTTGDTGSVTNTMLAGSIANAKLANSSVTVGTTNIALGTSSTTLAGLTSVSSTSFTGTLTGTATGLAGTPNITVGTIISTGNIGIGTSNPGRKLDVNGIIRVAENSAIEWGWGNTAIVGNNNNEIKFLYSDGTLEAMRIKSGNVGIGMTNPANAALQVGKDISALVGVGQAQLIVNGATDNSKQLMVGFNTTANYGFLQTLHQGVNWSDYNLILQPVAGNVGIGTTAPGYKLDVAGDVNITGNYKINGVNLVTGMGGSGTANYIPMFAAGSTLTNSAMYQDGSGKVGVGTTSPDSKLHVNGNLKVSGNGLFQNSGNVNTTIYSTDLTGEANVTFANNSMNYTSGIFSDNQYGINYGSSRALTIRADGNVGIGTTNPGYKLDVDGSGNFVGSLRVVPVGDNNGLYVGAAGSSPFNANIAEFRYLGNGNSIIIKRLPSGGSPSITTSSGTDLQFSTAGVNSQMTLNTSGNVGIGTTAPGTKLEVIGAARFNPYTTFGSIASPAFEDAIRLGPSGHASSIQFGNEFHSTHGTYINFQVNSNSAPSTPVNVMTFRPSGNVGIGTTTPNLKLTVLESSASIWAASFGAGSANPNWLALGTVSSGIPIIQGYSNSYDVAANISLQPWGGNVGIGTTVPNGALEIAGNAAGGATKLILSTSDSANANSAILWRNNLNATKAAIGSNFHIGDANGNLEFMTNGTNLAMVINSTGNVGIGRSFPLARLDVNGAGRFNELWINNPAQTARYIIAPSAITANRIVHLPLLTGDDVFLMQGAEQIVTGRKVFSNGVIHVNNPFTTFNYQLHTSAITADRQITLPLLTGNDTFVFANTPQTLTGKTINVSNNNIIGVIRGSGAVNRIPKFIANDTVGLSDIYEAGGLTGFGVPSPQQKIHVEGNIRISGVGRGIIFSDGTTLTSALSNVGITGIFQMPAFVQGTFYMNNLHNNILGLTSFPIIANTVYLMPFVVAGNRNFSIDQIGINVEVAATAGTFSAVIGIYNDGGIGVPNQLVNQVTVTGLNSTGSKVLAITQTFEAGILYFLAIHSGCNCTIRALTANSQLSMGLMGSNDTIALNRIDRALTWGTALPIAWNFNAAERNTNSALQVIFRAAPTTAPATPTGLSVTQNTGFDVSAIWNTVPLASTYVLEHRINGGAITQVETSANSWWNNPPYVAGQLVEVRVAARNNIGISAFTVWAGVTIVGAPDVPIGLAVIESGGGHIQATWNASLHATSYVVESMSNTFGARTSVVSTTSWGGDGVYNIGDNVTVRVAARNNRGDSAFSTPVGVSISGL